MGVVHFAGLGKSPGAITTGLSYLKRKYGSSIVEAVVVFTSKEIASGEEKAFPCVYNKYCERQETESLHSKVKNEESAVKILKIFMEQEFPEAELYLVETDTNDFGQCFEAVAKVLLKFHPPGKVGKHIWANLTGGTNILNAALFQVAYLSGLIPRLYYIFVGNPIKDGRYLQRFSKKSEEFDYREIYVIPTTFDKRYQYLLEELHGCKTSSKNEEKNKEKNKEEEGWISAKELLSRLKNKTELFGDLDYEQFIRNYLNVWPGIERKGNRQTGQEDAVRLSCEGERLLELLKLSWFKDLLQRTTLSDSEEIIKSLKIKRLLPASPAFPADSAERCG